jgi:glycosyltransferase involved in cell wall biosynthesis
MNIAIVDYTVTRNNPAGCCSLRIVEGLCDIHNFTVFAARFENPRPDRIRWVRVPILIRPQCLQYILFQLVASLIYCWRYLVCRDRYDVVQVVESNFWFGDIAYFHFCHKAYLESTWAKTDNTGLAKVVRYWNHKLHAWTEPHCLRSVKATVVPSRGLASDLHRTYRNLEEKVVIVPNAISCDRMAPLAAFDRTATRRSLGTSDRDILLTFVALGNFEHKGLALLIQALQSMDATVRLCVVGGESDLVWLWRRRVDAAGLGERIIFAGMQKDVRRYLWAADGFILPSLCETFPLVALEAAAAGLPLLTTRVHGVEEYLLDGHNGILFDRTRLGVQQAITTLQRMTPEERRLMGRRARGSVLQYSPEAFVARWGELYSRLESKAASGEGRRRREWAHV